jgi:hypothetical protein
MGASGSEPTPVMLWIMLFTLLLLTLRVWRFRPALEGAGPAGDFALCPASSPFVESLNVTAAGDFATASTSGLGNSAVESPPSLSEVLSIPTETTQGRESKQLRPAPAPAYARSSKSTITQPCELPMFDPCGRCQHKLAHRPCSEYNQAIN